MKQLVLGALASATIFAVLATPAAAIVDCGFSRLCGPNKKHYLELGRVKPVLALGKVKPYLSLGRVK